MGFWTHHVVECTDCLCFLLNQPMLQEEFPWANDHCDLHTMLDGLLIVIGNDLGIVLLHVLTTRVKPTPKLGETGFESEVHNVPRCQTRCTKINCPSVGFVQFWLLNLLGTTVSAKTEGIFTPELSKTLYSLNLCSEWGWVCAERVEKPWHMSQKVKALVGGLLGALIGRAEASSKVDGLRLRLLEARSFIHSTLRLEYGSADEPSEPQLAFCRL